MLSPLRVPGRLLVTHIGFPAGFVLTGVLMLAALPSGPAEALCRRPLRAREPVTCNISAIYGRTQGSAKRPPVSLRPILGAVWERRPARRCAQMRRLCPVLCL
jgi:hypothetical protein